MVKKVVYKIVKTEGKKVTEVKFSSEELDAIYSAMSDYEHYGDEEAELADSITSKLAVLG